MSVWQKLLLTLNLLMPLFGSPFINVTVRLPIMHLQGERPMQYGFSIRRTAMTVAVAGCLLLSARTTLAQTTELGLGESVTPPPTLIAILGGTLVDSLTSPFNETFNGQTITGNVVSAVFQNGTPEDGVFGGTAYDFYYQINFTGGNSAITGVNPASFFGFRTSVGQIGDGDGVDGLFINGSQTAAQARRTIGGAGMDFDFLGFVPGTSSFTLVVRTNSDVFTRLGSIGILGSGVAASVTTIAPVPLTVNAPEPGALALLAVGMAGFVALRRRNA
jgi:hypothetical protein